VDDIPSDFDAIVCSLFLHHLDESAALQLLQKMGQAARPLVLVNDLERRTLGLLAARVVTRLLSASPVVHVDGPRSVEGAFTLDEARQLADRAGWAGAIATRHWPFRYLLYWRRHDVAGDTFVDQRGGTLVGRRRGSVRDRPERWPRWH